jgi:hypothetical protein
MGGLLSCLLSLVVEAERLLCPSLQTVELLEVLHVFFANGVRYP